MSLLYVALLVAALVPTSTLGQSDGDLRNLADTILLESRDADDTLAKLYQRAVENMPAEPVPFGPKYISGGAGEGTQRLSPEGRYPNKAEVKTDAVLPAYCNPPNPCPKGATETSGCQESGFENSAEYSRAYQEQQSCLCDEEHMFNCPRKQNEGNAANAPEMDAIEDMLVKKGIIAHKEMIAKKFHQQREYMHDGSPR